MYASKGSALAMQLLAAIVVALLLERSTAQTPIPSRPQGYQMLKAATEEKVVVEVFYDHLCDDSKANWPAIKEVVDTCAGMDDSVVSVIVHIFPLPYHHNAYFMQQAGEVVRRKNINLFERFIQFAFDKQDEFLGGAVGLNETQVKQKISRMTEEALDHSVSAASIMEGFDDSLIEKRSRYAWQYGCSRSISDTPVFLVNGVYMADGSNYDSKKWMTFIESLLKETSM